MEFTPHGHVKTFGDIKDGQFFVGEFQGTPSFFIKGSVMDVNPGPEPILLGPLPSGESGQPQRVGIIPTSFDDEPVFSLDNVELVPSPEISSLQFHAESVEEDAGKIIVTPNQSYLKIAMAGRYPGQAGYMALSNGQIKQKLTGRPALLIRKWSLQVREGDAERTIFVFPKGAT